jgi:hypothetical protein
VIVTFILYFSYASIVCVLKDYTEEMIYKNDEKDYTALAIWSIINASIGLRTQKFDISEFPLILVIQISFLIQLITHIPFIYYIGKESLLMMLDEYLNFNLTNMVDRIRFETGDPRYFLAELKQNSREQIEKGEA